MSDIIRNNRKWLASKAKEEELRRIKVKIINACIKSNVERRGKARLTPNKIHDIYREIIKGQIKQLNEDGMKKILCIVGESGTGKTTASLYLKRVHKANVICSFTSRQPRPGEVEGVEHHFIDIHPEKSEILAETKYGSKRYYALKSQVYGPCTVYVVDEEGLLNLINEHGDEYEIYSIYIMRDKSLRNGVNEQRMARDEKRMKLDLSFYNYVIRNDGTLNELLSSVENIYNEVKEK